MFDTFTLDLFRKYEILEIKRPKKESARSAISRKKALFGSSIKSPPA